MPLKAKSQPETPKTKPVGDEVFDDFDALVKTAQNSFGKAVREAVAENDRLGIDSPGTVQGKLTVRKAPLRKSTP